MSGDVVARAKAALEDVTGGSWTAQEFVQGKHCNLAFETFVDTDGYNSTRCLSLPKSKSDAEFIAVARSLVPELVDRLEFVEHEFEHERDRCSEHFEAWMSARAEVEKLRGALETIRRHALKVNNAEYAPILTVAMCDILDVIERAGIEP